MSNQPVSTRPRAEPTWRRCLLCLSVCAALGLAACGGGGGGGSMDDGGSDGSSDTPMDSLVVPDSMTWSTATEQALVLNVTSKRTGAVVADATVSVFTLTRTAPNGTDTLEEPVPVSLLESGVTDASGSLRFGSQIPAYLTEVLVVVSKGEASVSQAVATSSLGESLTLNLD